MDRPRITTGEALGPISGVATLDTFAGTIIHQQLQDLRDDFSLTEGDLDEICADVGILHNKYGIVTVETALDDAMDAAHDSGEKIDATNFRDHIKNALRANGVNNN